MTDKGLMFCVMAGRPVDPVPFSRERTAKKHGEEEGRGIPVGTDGILEALRKRRTLVLVETRFCLVQVLQRRLPEGPPAQCPPSLLGKRRRGVRAVIHRSGLVASSHVGPCHL